MHQIKHYVLSATIISLLVLLLAALEWSIIDRITPFLFLPLLLGVWLVFLLVAIFNLLCIAKARKIGPIAMVPIAIQALALAAVMFVPFTHLWLTADFAWYEKERMDVVQKVHSGHLTPNAGHSSGTIALGERYPLISMGGNKIIVEEHEGLKYIFFYTFSGILDNYSGFLHVPAGGNPKNYSDLAEAESTQIVPWRNNWFFVSHH